MPPTFLRIGQKQCRSASTSHHPQQPSGRTTKERAGFTRKWAIAFIFIGGGVGWYAYNRRKRQLQAADEGEEGPPVRMAKPWQIAAYSTLPLKAMSRLWGSVNSIDLPVALRAPSFRFYAWVFGANLDEIKVKDLAQYSNLSNFFYRELEDGARPIADSLLVSPSDGKVLKLGIISDDRRVEQVKGVTYSLDALLGTPSGAQTPASPDDSSDTDSVHSSTMIDFTDFFKSTDTTPEAESQFSAEDIMDKHKEFAVMNGISYTLHDLLGPDETSGTLPDATGDTPESITPALRIAGDLMAPDNEDKSLFFAVIYLAPGDYHRFHSPTNWVAEVRRHFVGELYSVAPYFQNKLANLFCLNERVALLGRWRHGFFSMTPVGATNVGSIVINFDKDLKTNTVRSRDEQPNHIDEASYANASRLLRGYPLEKGQEMGGFKLGSTVVLVFEAPKNFEFSVKQGDRVKMGQSLGA